MSKPEQPDLPGLARAWGVTNITALSDQAGLAYKTAHDLWTGSSRRDRHDETIDAVRDALTDEQGRGPSRREVIRALQESGAM